MAKLQSVNSVVGKETLYVDVDDEITAIIDKVGAAKSKVVALVLPKRCPVLQSVVNMKLLKRGAERAGKNLVLVTSEAGLMPLAGSIGLYVASTPSSKPAVPDAPDQPGDEPEEIDEPLQVADGNAPDADSFDPKAAAGTSVGELAAVGAAEAGDDEVDDSIDMNDPADDTPAADEEKDKKAGKKAKTPKPKKDKKLSVPNFDSFRKKLALGILVLILLVVAAIFAFTVLPKATITIGTDSNTITTNQTLSLDTTANQLNTADDTVPAVAQSQQKTNTQTVPATGQQNNGQKAAGTATFTVTMDPCSEPSSIPTGTTLTANNNTYVLDDSVTFQFGGFGHGGSSCTLNGEGSTGESDIPITALNAGSASNVSSATFTVTGDSDVSASGSASGGTDDVVTVVQQSDITNATNKVNSANAGSMKQQLESGLESQGLQPVPATFLAGTPQITTSAQVGSQASNVTVTAVATYTMLGVQKSYLKTLVDSNVDGQLDKGKQVILNDGVANAQFAEGSPGTATSATVAMTVKSQVGPQINTTSLKKSLAGLKSQDVQNYVKQTPGVTSVSVKYSPFWVDTVPKKAAKVQIRIVKAGS